VAGADVVVDDGAACVTDAVALVTAFAADVTA
jgi:hypothetical protein